MFSAEQLEDLFGAISEKRPRYRPLFLFLVDTGARIGKRARCAGSTST